MNGRSPAAGAGAAAAALVGARRRRLGPQGTPEGAAVTDDRGLDLDRAAHPADAGPQRDRTLDALGSAAADGDRAAFAELCRALEGDVRRYCQALLGDAHLAEDAAQETFVRAVTAVRRYRGEGPVRLWMLVLARRAAARTLRQHLRHRDRRAECLLEAPAPGHAGAVEVGMLIRELPEPHRQAFALTQLLGLRYEEAAVVCGCRVGTIRSRVHRARERLIAELHAQEGRHASCC